MRIAILHYSLAPVIGGVERLIEDQAVALRRLGHEVQCMDQPSAFRHWLEGVRGQRASGEVAVLVHNLFTMPFDLRWTRELTRLAARHGWIRWVNWIHDISACNPHYAHLNWSEPPPQALHVAISPQRKRQWLELTGLPSHQVQVIANGIDRQRILGITPRVAALGLGDAELVLVQPARLVRRKNIELGIALMAHWKKRGRRARLVVTGAVDPHQPGAGLQYFNELQSLVATLGVEQEVCLAGLEGPLSEEDVRSLYQLADALFFPSTSEGFGLPLLEALAHRLPVFCTDLPVHRSVLGALAVRFAAKTPISTLSARILRVLNSAPMKQRRRLLGHTYCMQRICREELLPWLSAPRQGKARGGASRPTHQSSRPS
jgi:glycosyltransferase involved in cell wall biosynthesis